MPPLTIIMDIVELTEVKKQDLNDASNQLTYLMQKCYSILKLIGITIFKW